MNTQVQAQHPYTGDDEDELTFDKGDIIYVVEFSDPDEQVSFIHVCVCVV